MSIGAIADWGAEVLWFRDGALAEARKAGLKVGRIGVSASDGVPAAAVEDAVERRANFLTWLVLPITSVMVSFTATSWKQLLDPRRAPAGERVPIAADCYRFVLTRPEVASV